MQNLYTRQTFKII